MFKTHYSSPCITIDDDNDHSSASMGFQAETDHAVEVNKFNINRSTTPNTLHKILIEIAQQRLINPYEQMQNGKVN